MTGVMETEVVQLRGLDSVLEGRADPPLVPHTAGVRLGEGSEDTV
jgi:hypothetical protein